MTQLRAKIHRVIVSVAQRDVRRQNESYQEHARIVTAMIAGEAERATALLVEHLESGRSCLLGPRDRSRNPRGGREPT